MRSAFFVFGILCLAALGGPPMAAKAPDLIPREVLFGNPERTNPHLSPDGKLLAYLAPDKKNVLQVFVRTVGQKDDRQLTRDKKRGIRMYFWAYDGQHLLYLQDTDGDENFHVYSTDLKTGLVRDLTPFQGVRAQGVELSPDVPHEALIGLSGQAQGFGVFGEEYDVVDAVLNVAELFHAFTELIQPFIEAAALDHLHAFEATPPDPPKEEIIPRRIVQQHRDKRF